VIVLEHLARGTLAKKPEGATCISGAIVSTVKGAIFCAFLVSEWAEHRV